jgi:hypothetical protein
MLQLEDWLMRDTYDQLQIEPIRVGEAFFALPDADASQLAGTAVQRPRSR